ncbi:MAG: radical SAM protein [Oligoflexia bacterium]|nr:radical SAM protein [Oligoflexia bacterium]
MSTVAPRQDGPARLLRRRVRFWRNIAISAALRRVDPDWVPRPHAGHMILTFRCNLRCDSCASWQVKEHNDLSTDEWLGVFRQLRSLDVVKILGGEPFVRPDIVHVLAGVREIIDPYVMQLTTNGMLTSRVVDAIEQVAWPGLQLRISIDGLEQTHDQGRGVQGSWRQVMATARAVADLKARHGFHFGINFSVTDTSLRELDAMVSLAKELGADLIPGVCVDPFLVGTRPPEVCTPRVLYVDDKGAALKAIADSRVGSHAQLNGLDNLLFRLSVQKTFQRELHGNIHQFTCRELRDLLYLLPNGDVVRCGLDHRPVGNVRQQSFDQIWFGDTAREHRCRVDACPGCLQASVQIMSRAYAGELRA